MSEHMKFRINVDSFSILFFKRPTCINFKLYRMNRCSRVGGVATVMYCQSSERDCLKISCHPLNFIMISIWATKYFCPAEKLLTASKYTSRLNRYSSQRDFCWMASLLDLFCNTAISMRTSSLQIDNDF